MNKCAEARLITRIDSDQDIESEFESMSGNFMDLMLELLESVCRQAKSMGYDETYITSKSLTLVEFIFGDKKVTSLFTPHIKFRNIQCDKIYEILSNSDQLSNFLYMLTLGNDPKVLHLLRVANAVQVFARPHPIGKSLDYLIIGNARLVEGLVHLDLKLCRLSNHILNEVIKNVNNATPLILLSADSHDSKLYVGPSPEVAMKHLNDPAYPKIKPIEFEVRNTTEILSSFDEVAKCIYILSIANIDKANRLSRLILKEAAKSRKCILAKDNCYEIRTIVACSIKNATNDESATTCTSIEVCINNNIIAGLKRARNIERIRTALKELN